MIQKYLPLCCPCEEKADLFKISNGLFFPQGFKFFLFIIREVINKLNNDLKNTNSYIGILLSIIFTQTVIRLKKKDASIRFTSFNHSKSLCITNSKK